MRVYMSMDEATKFTLDNYSKILNVTEISRLTGKPYHIIRKILLENGVKILSKKEANLMRGGLNKKSYKHYNKYKDRVININIELPKDDVELLLCDIDDVYEHVAKLGGIYKFYNENDELLYIGKATSLPYRLQQHIQGKTHTKYIHHNFHKVKCIYINDETERVITEIYLIKMLKPKLNVSHASSYKSEIYLEEYQLSV